MKILHIVRQFYPTIGGMENYVYHLAEQQANLGHEISVLTLNRNYLTNEELPSGETLGNGIKVNRIPYRFSRKYPVAVQSFRYLKGADLVIVHGVDFFMDFISITKILHGKKIILITHGGFFHTPYAKKLKKIFFNTVTRFNIKRYNAVIGCSDNDIEQFTRIAPGIHLVNNGVNTEPYINSEKRVERDKLVYIGRITRHKRVDNLIRLIAKLHEKGHKIKLHIVGPDWENIGNELKELANQLNISEYIVFEGAIQADQLIEMLSGALAFVSASEYEGFGISAVEAMASGTYCVLNDIPSFRFLLKEKRFGKVTDFNNPDLSSELIIEARNLKEEEYLKLSKEAKEFSSQFGWKKVALKIEHIIKSL